MLFPVNDLTERCLFVWGSAGTGKTLILMEALKIKLSKLRYLGRRVRILATTFYDWQSELRKKFDEKYLENMKDVEVVSVLELCGDLGIEFNKYTPRDTMNRVITALSDSSDTEVVLLLIDEVPPCHEKQTSPDWRHIEVKENVIWLLALSPRAFSANSTEVLPPEDSFVLTRHLVVKHRNCPQIRNIIMTINIPFKEC